MKNPLISIIIPTYNSAKTIGRAIESIANQTYKNIEIIIVDDNSNDNTINIVKPFTEKDSRIHYYKVVNDDSNRYDPILKRNINAGYSARNFGFEKVNGELITFQDADDVSFLNRIETQLNFLHKYNATHITMSWLPFDELYIHKIFDADMYIKDNGEKIINPNELYNLSQKSKGVVYKILPSLARKIPFHWKRKRIINKLFFGTLNPYPGAGNSPLFKRSVLEKVKFRKLSDRVWPSFMGRGADRDFNFQVAETFKNSFTIELPMYMWHTRENNDSTANQKKYSKYIK